MTNIVTITTPPGVKTMGLRSSATPYATALHKALSEHKTVVLDFESIEVTQGFVDGILATHIHLEGKEGLKRITFRNCIPETQAIIKFVVNDRLSQRNAQPAP